jgi:hypothetical protein
VFITCQGVGLGNEEWEDRVVCETEIFVGIGNGSFDGGGYEFNPGAQFTAVKGESGDKGNSEYIFVVGK